MKLIQQSKLYYKEGNSDKVYEIDLCELAPNEYLVNFRYGRRGKPLKEGTKTPAALPQEKAEAIFSSLEKEKKNKGYQTEIETFIELPILDAVAPDSKNGVILQRLQDAVEGKNSFKTEWKTSRVIWKAAYLQIEEAIPFIIKLASKGDELQTYASLWALNRLKASQAKELLKNYAFQAKQKKYIRNIAYEGFLNLADDDEKKSLQNHLLEKLPPEIKYNIEVQDFEALSTHLLQYSEEGKVSYFSDLYLLCKIKTELLPFLVQIIKTWPFRAPYFKQIRSIYKLAQIRKDYVVLADLAYRFEKESSTFNSGSWFYYDQESREYIEIEKELKKQESRIAFSNQTKNYFQKNAMHFLKNTGKESDSREYIKLAVSILLNYRETDYSPAGERPSSEYGIYDYKTKLYQYILFDYPECSESLLLSTILLGNDSELELQPNLKYIKGKRTVVSTSYYFNPSTIEQTASNQSGNTNSENSIGKVIKNIFGRIIGKNTEEEKVSNEENKPEEIKEELSLKVKRKELYPEYWDAVPEAYIQLLMQAQLDVIHKFAYQNLKERSDFETITLRFGERDILQLLQSRFKLPNQLGFETVNKRKDEFLAKPEFIAKVLDSNSALARNWAKEVIESDLDFYFSNLEFILLVLFNNRRETNQSINELLQKTKFTEDRLQAIIGKVVAELMQLDNTEENNKKAKTVVKRLNIIALSQFDKISWAMVEQLMTSPLEANMFLASSIVVHKSKKISSTEIPVSLVNLFLQNEIKEVRTNGIELLNQYPTHFLVQHIDFIVSQVDNSYQDVVEDILVCIRKITENNQTLGNQVIKHLAYTLIRKEKFEGSHILINEFVRKDLKQYWNTGLGPKDLTKFIHSQYRQSQLTAYEILKEYNRKNELTLGQIISFGNHEILAIRQWCWNYFKENVPRIRYEKEKSLNLMDSRWEDTRAYAFHFFKQEFTEADWDTDTLISIVDSIRPDVENFGKELITRYFKPEFALDFLTKLSEHPSVHVQAFVTGYLSIYAADKPHVIKGLNFYFRSVLTRVNKARIAKDRIFKFLHHEALKKSESAEIIVPILDDISAQSTIQDKATCIHILTEVKKLYPHLDMHLALKN